MEELKRRQGFARSYGIEDTELLTPAEAAERIPLLDPRAILGALPRAERRHREGRADRDGARARGGRARASRSRAASPSPGSTSATAACTGCETDRGTIECERVLICAGIWGPTVGALAGVPIPLVAVQHQLVWTDPDPRARRRDARGRAPDRCATRTRPCTSASARITTASGNYRHEPIVTPQRAIRRHGDGPMPSLMPFTPEDFASAEARDRAAAPRARRAHATRATPRGRSTGCSRSRRTPARSWASPRRSVASGCARPSG